MISLLNIAEQCQAILGKGTAQELVQAVRNSYGVAVKNNWFENKQNGIDEINGGFQYTYSDLKPELDRNTNKYYITIPSSYLELPHQMGINHVSFMDGQDSPFLIIATSQSALFSGLKSEGMGGLQKARPEGNRMYFDDMAKTDIIVNNNNRGILLKITVGLDTVDVDEQLNISPSVTAEIVDAVVNLYQIKERGAKDTLV